MMLLACITEAPDLTMFIILPISEVDAGMEIMIAVKFTHHSII